MIFTPVNEAYFGKTKEIQNIENQLDIFRNKYMGRYILNMKVNTDPELIKLNRMFEDYFGFGCFMIDIINEPITNAFTVPVDYRYDVVRDGSDLLIDKKGYKFKREKDYSTIVTVYSGAIFNPEFTTGEIMALILHEIGHNFAAAINGHHGVMTNIYVSTVYSINCIALISGNIFALKELIGNEMEFVRWINNIKKKLLQSNSTLLIIPGTFRLIKSIINTANIAVSDIDRILTGGIGILYKLIITTMIKLYNGVKNPIGFAINTFSLPIRYGDERIADNFPTMYGYGQDNISLQDKLNTSGADSASVIMKKFNKIPVLSTLVHMTELPPMLIFTLFDEHPEGIGRCKDQLDLLKHEVQKEDLDPKMKKVLLADIAACEKQLSKVTDLSKGVKDPYLCKKAYYKLLAEFTDSKDLKDALLDRKDKRFAEYDKRYNEKCNS